MILWVDIPDSTRKGKNLVVYHDQGLGINENVIIGDMIMLRYNTTGNYKKDRILPTIEVNVEQLIV